MIKPIVRFDVSKDDETKTYTIVQDNDKYYIWEYNEDEENWHNVEPNGGFYVSLDFVLASNTFQKLFK